MVARKADGPRFGPEGTRLWLGVQGEFELAAHEETLLEQLCHTADTITVLRAAVDRDGAVVSSEDDGARPHPLLRELRLQALAFTQLVKALRLPAGLVDEPPAPPKPKVRHGMRELRAVQNTGPVS